MKTKLILLLLAGCGTNLNSDEHGVCGTDATIDSPAEIDAPPIDAPSACYAVLLTGDSNARGDARVPDLTGADVALATEYSAVEFRVHLANGTANPPAWTEYPVGGVRPVSWVGIDRFGIEVTMARDLVATRPDVRWVIIKAAIGGTTLYDTWNPNTSAPWVFVNVHDGLDAQLAETGCTPVAYVWEHGGQDALQVSRANAYNTRLPLYVDAVRLRYPGIPFIYGRLHNSSAYPYAGPVRTAQENLPSVRAGVHMIDQDAGTLRSDGYHYNTPSVITLGHAFAAQVLSVAP